MIATLVLVAAAATPAVAAPSVRTTGTTLFDFRAKHIRVGGWTWLVAAELGGGSLDFEMRATKRLQQGSHPEQIHEWQNLSLPGADLVTDHADLMPTRLDTGTDLGSYGAIDVTLGKGTTLVSRVRTCAATGAVIDRIHSRTGTFSGSFDFKPGTGLPADVAPVSIKGTISKEYATGRTCPVGDGAPACPSKSIDGYSAAGQENVYATKTPAGTTLSFGWVSQTSAAGFQVRRWLLGEVPSTAVAITSKAAVIHSRPFGDWASGRLSFSLKERRQVKISDTCIRTAYDATSETGTITAHLASGDIAFAPHLRHTGVMIWSKG